MARKSVGRKKLAMRKMTNKSNLDVTFSKRRTGLFKKAYELCTLCMCEIAMIVFSPQQKPYSLGHPTIESVLNRFLNGNPPTENSRTDQLVASLREDNILKLNTELANLNDAIEIEKKRAKSLGEKMKAQRSDYWWLRPIDELNVEEVQKMLLAVDEMQKNARIGQLERSISSTLGAVSVLQYNNTPFFGASSSGPSFDPARTSGPTVGVPSVNLARTSGVRFPPRFNSGFAPFIDPTRVSGGFSGGGFQFVASNPHFEFMDNGSSSGSSGGDALAPDDGNASGLGSRDYVGDRDKGKAPMMD